jgi:hypothetical protein
MRWLQRQIEDAGYATFAPTYPSRRRPIDALARHLEERIRDEVGGGELYAVTHSLGGIIVRHMSAVPFRAVVMLAPPNNGSRLAAALRDLPLYRFIYGPVGSELAEPDRWPPPPRPCGVIAGTRARSAGNPTSWLSTATRLLPPGEPGDGTLLVEETRLPQLDDFTTVDASHTWILRHAEVPRLVTRFFESGRFRDQA